MCKIKYILATCLLKIYNEKEISEFKIKKIKKIAADEVIKLNAEGSDKMERGDLSKKKKGTFLIKLMLITGTLLFLGFIILLYYRSFDFPFMVLVATLICLIVAIFVYFFGIKELRKIHS